MSIYKVQGYIKQTATLFLILASIVPTLVFARHNDYRVDRDDLDEDIVEDMPVPVLFALTHEDLTENYGDLRDGGSRLHEGLDMFAPEGTPIVSPTEAVVIRTGTGESSGRYVYTANPGGETFRYMHLAEIADIDPGDRLEVGDLIGTVGDTGNAPDGVYHLHLEIRDKDNNPTDPFDRLTETFTTKKQVSFIEGILNKVDDESEYIDFLLEAFPDVFEEALKEAYDLPREIEQELKKTDAYTTVELQAQLDTIIKSIPSLLPTDIGLGDSGVAVLLLQLYLIHESDGPAHSRLVVAGATGYFGPITFSALAELQATKDIATTGLFDTETKIGLSK